MELALIRIFLFVTTISITSQYGGQMSNHTAYVVVDFMFLSIYIVNSSYTVKYL